MMENLFCQSCGMPLNEEVFATNADGSQNQDYCKFCYDKGAFLQPDMTMQEMIDFCVPFLVKDMNISEAEAKGQLQEIMPRLKRWQQA